MEIFGNTFPLNGFRKPDQRLDLLDSQSQPVQRLLILCLAENSQVIQPLTPFFTKILTLLLFSEHAGWLLSPGILCIDEYLLPPAAGTPESATRPSVPRLARWEYHRRS